MDKIWINFCGMPVCFSLQGFTIVTGLRCHHPEEPPIAKGTPLKISKARKLKEKIDGLFDIARRGYKALDLLTDIMDKTIPKQYREQLCLIWFAHSVISARDVNRVIEDDLLARAEDFDKFNNYPWGYDSFYLTVQYLLTKLSSGTTTLYGFPWAFMAWAFEAIPPLRKQVMDYPNKVSHPRIFRWLAAKSNTKIKEADLFNPSGDAVRLFHQVK
ncbi:putative glycerol-3-phosphate 2-O-acyltransferase 6-like [Capsicum annuum]|nr:putative glycerol-3-phosphate 2-O-acyltransferase 6-like [Capsicum annuum]